MFLTEYINVRTNPNNKLMIKLPVPGSIYKKMCFKTMFISLILTFIKSVKSRF